MLVSPGLLLWIRDEFHYSKDDFGKIFVHGQGSRPPGGRLLKSAH